LKPEISTLQLKDAWQLPEIMKTYLPAEVYELTTFSCSGYGKYVEVLLSMPVKWCESRFYGVYVDGKLVGFAEWRHLGDILFLNNICILPQRRGMGIGNILFKKGLEYAKRYGISAVCLDVFNWNIQAQTWYQEMGFQVMHETSWKVGENIPRNDAENSRELILREYPQAEAAHLLYGFSAFSVKTKQSDYTIGRIKDSYFRLADISAITDRNLLQGLYRIDPKRSVLVFCPNDKKNNSSFLRTVTGSLRMKLLINNNLRIS